MTAFGQVGCSRIIRDAPCFLSGMTVRFGSTPDYLDVVQVAVHAIRTQGQFTVRNGTALQLMVEFRAREHRIRLILLDN